MTQDVRSGPGGPVPGGLVPGDQLAGYQIQEPIGRGGMAVVYRALDLRLGRLVALKVLAPNLSEDEAFRQRFIRESRAAAGVDHPHIIPVFEAGEAAGMLFIAMRYVSHGDVRTLIDAEGRLDPARVVSLAGQAASALDAAHAHGLVHRDVKPGNMLLTPASSGDADHLYLSDFGLSKHSLTPSTLTSTGQFLGTLDYISPEQIQGHPVDGRADQYALACTVVEMLTGRPPFQRDDTMALMWAQLEAEPPKITARRPDLPAAANQVIATALSKWPDGRYPTCRDFAVALAAACLPETSPDIAADQPLSGAAPAGPGWGAQDEPTRPEPGWDAPAGSGQSEPGWGTAAGSDRAAQAGADWSTLAGSGQAGSDWGTLAGSGWATAAAAGQSAPAAEPGWAAPVPDPTWVEPAAHVWPSSGVAAEAMPEAELTAGPGWRDLPAAGRSGHVPGLSAPAADAPAWKNDHSGGTWPPVAGAARPARGGHRGRNVVIGLLIALVGLAGIAGIAYKLSHRQYASAPQATVTKIVSPAAAAAPAKVVRAYFAAINHHRWPIAWRLSGETGTYQQFKAGFQGTLRDTVTIESTSGDVVTAGLVARQADGTVKDYYGTYTVTNGVISATAVRQTN